MFSDTTIDARTRRRRIPRLSLPLSLSLPRHKGVHARLRRPMGGGNVVAPASATSALCRSQASRAMTSPLLSVRGVHTYYGSVAALKGVDVEVGDGEIVALIGSNGAGKSTLMMTICGNPRARQGSIAFDGRDITHVPTHEIARMRIAQSPEGRRIFVRMTVM